MANQSPQPHVGIVLGEAIDRANRHTGIINEEFKDRLQIGAEQLLDGGIDKLILTGGTGKYWTKDTEAELGLTWILETFPNLAERREDIDFENISKSTAQNLMNVVPILERWNARQLTIFGRSSQMPKTMVLAKTIFHVDFGPYRFRHCADHKSWLWRLIDSTVGVWKARTDPFEQGGLDRCYTWLRNRFVN